ncbi:hypothetical protein BU24DRAFT_425577 [Aaosphaeria arxii CBS 175.79]|uniref:Sodium/calcium exchanger membrane region domain-containing protein n=1 Tax=Aaosphaeria arxii CBS 175.79 TaxID=1450172 RepID=A0A6A5XJ74_9PLEO|nr:uncharacterized protein BU24DRAFT_425577 [Aaosphaeria arxii CBS 175.79]KAF2013003.1 hypothetical protein BU24DRAFT_425577 [Aaosphaeria arxii CBS 175.79]
MQHGFGSLLDGVDQERGRDADGDDDDLSGRTELDDVDDDDGILACLPSIGYRIFNSRPTISPPTPHQRSANGYTSFAKWQDCETSEFRQRFIQAARYTTNNWSIISLTFVPLGIASPYIGLSDTWIFIFNCIAIIPLADVLCKATDGVSSYLGETTGALLNVTMGNVTEVAIFVHALLQRQYTVLRTSLLGSIIVNILLVLGLVLVTGEYYQRGQVYNVLATRVAAGLLCLTTVSFLLPSILKLTTDNAVVARDMLDLGRAISIVLIVVYMIYLSTQLKSSKFAYKPLIQLDDPIMPETETVETSQIRLPAFGNSSLPPSPDISPPPAFDRLPLYHASHVTIPSLPAFSNTIETLQDIKTHPFIQKLLPILLLITSTALISICGGYLVNSIDHVVDHSPLSKTMVGLIILPIVGNAAELVSGIMFASRKQMDLAFGVSIGSALQIALFVTPLVTLIGWGIGREMVFHFSVFEVVTLIASTVLFIALTLDDRCSLLKGASLVAGYTVISLASYFVPDMD